ncbi:glycoside hydrolase family 12 protein [Hysterangium stoloniferum]|nr:glycoside hydrolase family 12 protein [Hysterangium stoloniferum]
MQFLAFLVLVPLLLYVDTSWHCGLWDKITIGSYTLLLNQWGVYGGTSDSWQCAQLTSTNTNSIAWKTSYYWAGGNGVKSFTNIQLNAGINRRLDEINSMPAVWNWSLSPTTGTSADVAFDLFTSNTPGGSNVNEIMIWMGNFKTGPIAYEYDSTGTAKPITTGISLGGYSWNLYIGTNGYNKVFSFLHTPNPITKFKADIFPFITYLIQHQGVASSQYLITAQGGLEPTSGSATFTTSAYSLSIH